METVYIETTIPSYLTARYSESICTLSRQIVTQKWWNEYRSNYRLFVSDVVYVECKQGDADTSKLRLQIIQNIECLNITEECGELAEEIFNELKIPEKARDDALHISIASVYKIDYLLSWNFRHIVNAVSIKKLNRFLDRTKRHIPQLCTPEELMT